MMGTITQEALYCNRCGREIELPESDHVSRNTAFLRYLSSRVQCRDCLAAARQRETEEGAQARRDLYEKVRANPRPFLSRCGVPSSLLSANFDRCPDLPEKMLADMKAWAEMMSGIVYLHGIPGSGKSWLAVSILRYVLTSGRLISGECLYIGEADYLASLRDSYENGELRKTARNLSVFHPRRVHLLVLDDLASSRLTDWGRGELSNLLEGRYADDLPTVLTSNMDLDELGEAIDPRISSRIASHRTVLEFPSRDLRISGSVEFSQ